MGRKTKIAKKHYEGWHPLIFTIFASFSLLLLPVIQDKTVMDPSMMPRLMAVLGMLVLLTIIFFFQKKSRLPDTSLLRMLIFPVFAGIVASIAFSMLFAINVSAGYYDLLKTFATLCYLIFATWIFLNTPTWPHLLPKFFVAGALLALAIGYYQYLTILGFGFHERGMLILLTGLMSNINLYASYLMLLLPALAYGIVTLRRSWRVLAIIATVLNLLLIFLLQTRAAYVGVFFGSLSGLILAIALWKRLHINKTVRNTLAIALATGIATLAGLFLLLPQDNKYIARASSIFTDTENPRLLIWDATTDMIADHPLTGVGAGNFTIVVQSYYGSYNLEGIDTNWLRPHNDYLWVLSEKGIFGLILFLAFFVIAIYYVAVVLNKDPDVRKKWFAVIVVGSIVAYMTNALFDFPLERINQQVLLMLYIAPVVAMVYRLRHNNAALSNAIFKPVAVVIMPLFFVGLIYCHHAIQLEKHVTIARQANVSGDWQTMLSAGQQAKTRWKSLDPLAVPVSFFEGFAYTKMGDLPKSLTAFLDAYEKNPYRKYILNNIGIIYLRQGEYDLAQSWFQKTLAMYPNDGEATRFMIDSMVAKGDYEEAMEWIERIPEHLRDERMLLLQENIIQALVPTAN